MALGPGMFRHNRTDATIAPLDRPDRPNNALDLDVRREGNTQRLMAFINFLFLFYIMYVAIASPLVIRAMKSGPFTLDQARFLQQVMPNVVITQDYLQTSILVIAAIIFIPSLYFSILLSKPAIAIIDNFVHANERLTRVVFYLGLCFAVSMFNVYLFFDVTLKNAALSVVAALVLAAALSSGGHRRNR